MNHTQDIPQVNTQDIFHCEYCAHQRFETGRGAYCKILTSGRVKGKCNFFEQDDIHLKMKKLVREERRTYEQRRFYFALNVGNLAIIALLIYFVSMHGDSIISNIGVLSDGGVHLLLASFSSGTQTFSLFKYFHIRKKHRTVEEKLIRALAILSNYGEVKYGKERLRS